MPGPVLDTVRIQVGHSSQFTQLPGNVYSVTMRSALSFIGLFVLISGVLDTALVHARDFSSFNDKIDWVSVSSGKAEEYNARKLMKFHTCGLCRLIGKTIRQRTFPATPSPSVSSLRNHVRYCHVSYL